MIKQGYRRPRTLTKYQRNRIVDRVFNTLMWLVGVSVIVLGVIYNDVIRW